MSKERGMWIVWLGTAGVLICLAMFFVTGCSALSSGMSWDEFQKALGPTFAERGVAVMSKADLFKAVGQPGSITEMGECIYLTYNLREGAVTMNLNRNNWYLPDSDQGGRNQVVIYRSNLVYSGYK